MTDTITLTGFVATPPRRLTTGAGVAITSFRLACTHRRFDRVQDKWIDTDTNWYTVTTFRQAALNAGASINKGDRVVVTGRLKIRNWESGGKSGTSVEVDADALGHDLAWGTSNWVRTTSAPSSQTEPAPPQNDQFAPADVQAVSEGGFIADAGPVDSEAADSRELDFETSDSEPGLEPSVATPF